jgi:hypothetical protein
MPKKYRPPQPHLGEKILPSGEGQQNMKVDWVTLGNHSALSYKPIIEQLKRVEKNEKKQMEYSVGLLFVSYSGSTRTE